MDAAQSGGFSARARRLLETSKLLQFGLWMAWMGGVQLLARFPGSIWLSVLAMAIGLLLLIGMALPWCLDPPFSEPSSDSFKEDVFVVPLFVCIGLVLWLVKPPWSVRITGILTAILLVGIGRFRHRACYVSAASWCVAGLAVARYCVWPAEQQYALLALLGGIATTAQGGLELIGSRRARAATRSENVVGT